MATLALEQVSKIYDNGVEAVRGLDLEVADGEFVVLVGPSGCGKTTALRMVAGLEEITTGTIRLDGKVVNDLSAKDRDIAMVFQNYALYPHLTVHDNIAFSLSMRGVRKAERDRRSGRRRRSSGSPKCSRAGHASSRAASASASRWAGRSSASLPSS